MTYNPGTVPKPGEEFTAEHFSHHLDLLRYAGPWFEALGFSMVGNHSFPEAFQTLADFCQDGADYQGTLMAMHVSHMKKLYSKFLYDMHQSLRAFWVRNQQVGNEAASDVMFPEEGVFYGTYHRLMEDTHDSSRLSRLGYMANAPTTSASRKTPRRVASPGSDDSPAHQKRSKSPKPDYGTLGSFAWAVCEDAETINVAGSRYSKPKILGKLNLREDEICLASFLCKRGAAACPCPEKAGHESLNSALHQFSTAQNLIRPSLDEPPYRLVRTTGPSNAARSRGQGSARGGRRGGGNRQGGSRGGRK